MTKLATKSDLRELRGWAETEFAKVGTEFAKVRSEIHQSKVETIRWIIGQRNFLAENGNAWRFAERLSIDRP